MATNTFMPVAVLATVVDSLKQQVHSAVDSFCTATLQTSSDLSGDGYDEFASRNGLETAMLTLSTVLHQLKDKENVACPASTEINISSMASSLNTSTKEVATVSNETHNVLLSRINKLERSMLEIVQKGEQMEQRQKVLEETSATKKELCDLQGQLSEEGSTFNQRLQDLERSQIDTSHSMGQKLSEMRFTVKELDKKVVNFKDSMFSVEADVCLLKGNVSHVLEEISDTDSEKKDLQVGDRMSQIELKTSVIEKRLKKIELTKNNQGKELKTKIDLINHMLEKKVNNLEGLKVILNQLNDRTTERAALGTKMDQMEQNLSQLSKTVGDLQQTVSSPSIAFCARLAAENQVVEVNSDEILDKFSTLLCNAGNTLDATTGIFTAPREGLYGFASWVEKERDDDSGAIEVAVTRRRNTTGLEDHVGYLSIDEHQTCNSITCILRLKTGDKVFQEITDAYEGAQLTWSSTFAGWLIR